MGEEERERDVGKGRGVNGRGNIKTYRVNKLLRRDIRAGIDPS